MNLETDHKTKHFLIKKLTKDCNEREGHKPTKNI